MSAAPRPTYAEHDAEPVPGLPGQLPAGEAILWQGAPRFGGLARRAMHLGLIAVYFAILGAWRAALILADGGGAMEAAQGAVLLGLLGAVPVALLAAYAWASARSTIYTITTRRVVIRTGVALPMTINIPFAVIGSAGVAVHGDGTGDIALQVMAPHRVSWLALWPHLRGLHPARPQPMLRAVPQPEAVAQTLGRALAAAAAMPVRTMAPKAEAASRPSAEAMA